MCNHYRSLPGAVEWVQKFIPGITIPTEFPEFRTEMFPKYIGPVVIEVEGKRELCAMRWGVWPYYQDKPQYITNARSDGLLKKPTWKQSAQHRRCIIPATGYYEPGLGPVGARGEVFFTVENRQSFCFAGLWDRDKLGQAPAFAMVTTEPNDYARRFHDRMPVVLSDEEALSWLGDEQLSDARLLALCRGLPAEALHHEEIAAKTKITRSTKEAESGELPGMSHSG